MRKKREDPALKVVVPPLKLQRKHLWTGLLYMTLLRNSLGNCKYLVGIDANQLQPPSICKATHTGLYTTLNLDFGSGRNRKC